MGLSLVNWPTAKEVSRDVISGYDPVLEGPHIDGTRI